MTLNKTPSFQLRSLRLQTIRTDDINLPDTHRPRDTNLYVAPEVIELLVGLLPPVVIATGPRWLAVANVATLRAYIGNDPKSGKAPRSVRVLVAEIQGIDPKTIGLLIRRLPGLLVGHGPGAKRKEDLRMLQSVIGKQAVRVIRKPAKVDSFEQGGGK